MKNNSFFILFIVVVVAIGVLLVFQEESPPNVIHTQELPTSSSVGSGKSKDPLDNLIEKTFEKGPDLIAGTVEWLEERKEKKDSLRVASRDKIYSIQIGLPKSNEKDALSAYKLVSARLGSVKIFKRSKTEYFIVKQDGSSKTDLESVASELAVSLREKNVRVIDLMTFCGKKEILKEETQKISKERVPCLICD